MARTAVSLYSGAGGLDLGIRAAGFRIIASVERDPDCCRTLRANGCEGVFEGPVEKFDAAEALAAAGVKRGALDLLFGGPPCQPFSKSAYWTTSGPTGLADPRAATLATFLAVVEQLQPKVLLIENVEGFARNGGLSFIVDGLEAINLRTGSTYRPQDRLLNAAEYGVPQTRRRLFIVALRSGASFDFPTKTHGDGESPFVTPWDAFSSVVTSDEHLALKGRWADLLPSIPEGENYLWHTSRSGGLPIFGWRTRYWSFLYKLARDKPSPTIVASPSQNTGPYHWDNRLLSTTELARLQSFPAAYELSGNRASRQRQIGNAVPPLLAECVGRSILAALGDSTRTELKLAVRDRGNVPAASASRPVPEKYLHLVGDHAAHPGTGRGPKGKKPEQRLQLPAE